MSHPPYKVLFLCTGNSARSIIAEHLLRAKGKGRFEVSSAGTNPKGEINPYALWVLAEHYRIDASGARSKSWDELKAIPFDFVITVCDAAREACPILPGKTVTAHFGSPDPAAVEGTDDQKKWAFVQVASQISQRLDLFCALTNEQLSAERVRHIGTQHPMPSSVA